MPFRPHIERLKPYVAQAPIDRLQVQYGIAAMVKLSANEGAFGPVHGVAEQLAHESAQLRRYPDSAGLELRDAIAQRHVVSLEHVVLGNGADELIRLAGLATLEPGDNGVFPWPSFPTYVSACAAVGGVPKPVALNSDWSINFDALAAAIDDRTRVVFIANPNNPTGLLAPRVELERFVDNLPRNVLLVLDEAYAEYAGGDDEPQGINLVREGVDNLVVLRTFSKIYGLAGLRIGYAVASRPAASALDRVRSLFNVNAPAQHAALLSLTADDEVARRASHVRGARTQILKWLALAGHKPLVSRANFVCAEVAGGDGPALAEALLREGVMIRALDGFGAPQAVRVTVGTDIENQYFAAALDRVCGG
ncbi:MAG: histidinol-phosphate transaminase [Thermoleophilaceae bacterium]|nr:histidinol-phosphate transaminase [Thermoleophilaceae bacterium]